MDEGRQAAIAAADWAGTTLAEPQLARLDLLAQWLVDEAMPAGGLGPHEGGKVWRRHIADSLTFGVAFKGIDPPSEILDVGTGVGLPGIPLALALPDTTVTLLDRGGRRITLLHRIVGILELTNVVIEQADIHSVADDHWHAMTYRGAVSAPEAVGLTSKLLADDGTSVLGLSTRPDRPQRAEELIGVAQALGLDAELREVPNEALDGGAWLLIMRRSGTDDAKDE
ncbi:MAG: class I SAM-dependent methyltransferase [Acidimicrobiia bacterium]|nr:class I SAM-dependent methyltransferase [Acidimicrobiia bacterium]MDH3470767.1 class I SAM-dependent methyltransferase [Acidimicrobiia bacterium]